MLTVKVHTFQTSLGVYNTVHTPKLKVPSCKNNLSNFHNFFQTDVKSLINTRKLKPFLTSTILICSTELVCLLLKFSRKTPFIGNIICPCIENAIANTSCT